MLSVSLTSKHHWFYLFAISDFLDFISVIYRLAYLCVAYCRVFFAIIALSFFIGRKEIKFENFFQFQKFFSILFVHQSLFDFCIYYFKKIVTFIFLFHSKYSSLPYTYFFLTLFFWSFVIFFLVGNFLVCLFCWKN